LRGRREADGGTGRTKRKEKSREIVADVMTMVETYEVVERKD
jgi:hypothetical protein